MSRFRAADRVRCAVEATGIVLINDATGVTTALDYPQAAIWDFLMRGESTERMTEKVSVIASLDPAAARALVMETVAAWWEAGLVVPAESSG